ncbi:MAG TPA: hypothetical protein VGC37_14055 [Friedmanniella sp.]
MSSSHQEPDVPADETTESQVAADPESQIGKLTVEDDPQGTVDPSDLAGTASDSDEDVS